jgi:hypothetical protein
MERRLYGMERRLYTEIAPNITTRNKNNIWIDLLNINCMMYYKFTVLSTWICFNLNFATIIRSYCLHKSRLTGQTSIFFSDEIEFNTSLFFTTVYEQSQDSERWYTLPCTMADVINGNKIQLSWCYKVNQFPKQQLSMHMWHSVVSLMR